MKVECYTVLLGKQFMIIKGSYCLQLLGLLYLEDEDTTILQNVGDYLPNDTELTSYKT